MMDWNEEKKKNTDMWQPYYNDYSMVKPVYFRTCIDRNIQSANTEGKTHTCHHKSLQMDHTVSYNVS